jgi:osmotically-inducible protein OsmY
MTHPRHHRARARQAQQVRGAKPGLRTAAVLALAAATLAMSACAPLVVGGAMVGGALMATDRRTAGMQVEDQGIELKAQARVRQVVGERSHVNITSYNRTVLVTGEAATEGDRAAIEQAVKGVENVRSVVNELAIMGASSMTSRSNDTLVSTRVKAAYVEAKDVQANVVKVITERGVVYLMGRVTEREANRATEVARAVNGVLKVVRVFEIVSEADLPANPPSPR